jgi:hypothetical protein
MENKYLRMTYEQMTRYRQWLPVTALISMDIAAELRNELGMGEFYCDGLRDVAREWLVEWFAGSVERTPWLVGLRGRLMGSMERDEVRSFRAWMKDTFPTHAEAMRCWLWMILLQGLSHLWEDDDVISAVPLGAPDLADTRLMVRDYLAQCKDVRLKSELLQPRLRSKWDAELKKHSFGRLILVEAVHRRYAKKLWIALRSSVSPEELAALAEWGRAIAKREKMPLKYTGLPCRDA